MAKVIEENKNVGLSFGGKFEHKLVIITLQGKIDFSVRDTSRKAKSVNKAPSRSSISKDKSKSPFRSHLDNETNHNNAFLSKNQKLLPYLNQPNQRYSFEY